MSLLSSKSISSIISDVATLYIPYIYQEFFLFTENYVCILYNRKQDTCRCKIYKLSCISLQILKPYWALLAKVLILILFAFCNIYCCYVRDVTSMLCS